MLEMDQGEYLVILRLKWLYLMQDRAGFNQQIYHFEIPNYDGHMTIWVWNLRITQYNHEKNVVSG
jgi:hypothetical protein